MANAIEHADASVAFPIIGAGSGGAKLERALGFMQAAFAEIDSDIPVRIVRFTKT